MDIAERLVKKVAQPNLLLDQTVVWDCDVAVIPRLNSTPANYAQFPFSDTDQAITLNLPVLRAEHVRDLDILATGPYTKFRGNVTLTATRELELREAF